MTIFSWHLHSFFKLVNHTNPLFQELEDEVLEWIGEEKGCDVDDIAVLFNVEQALGMKESELVSYMTSIVTDNGIGSKADVFIDKFKPEIESLRDYDSGKK